MVGPVADAYLGAMRVAALSHRFACLFALSSLVGCGAAPIGVRASDPPAPKLSAAVKSAAGTFPGAGGVEIFFRHHRPAAAPKAILVVHHGLLDHGDRYGALVEALVAGGFGASTMDMRGHGRSAGARFAIDRFDDYLEDLDAFVKLVAANDPGVPVFVFGHSLGGLVVATWAAERAPSVAGIVLSAPGLAFDAPPLQAAVLRTFDVLAPGARVFSPPQPDFSTRAEVVADMGQDPLVHQGGGQIAVAAQALEGARRLWSRVAAFDRPLLVLHGTIDKLTAPAGSRDFVQKVSSKDKTLRLYPGLAHDLVHEPDAGRVIGDVVAWIAGQTGGPKPDAPSLPTTPLVGDRGPSALSLVLGGGAEVPRDADAFGGAKAGGVATISTRGLVGRVGWAFGLDLGLTTIGGTRLSADAYLLGLGARFAGAGTIALTGGFGVGGARGTKATRVPLELALELPLGPLHVVLRQGLAVATTGPTVETKALGPFADAWGMLGVRFGRDLRYWADVHAGAGPFLGVTYRRLGAADVLGVVLGLDLFGAD